nr:hypothetical protein [Candidatus Sigynarchaeota archaeon]
MLVEKHEDKPSTSNAATKASNGIDFMIFTIVMNALSMHFFLQTLRSIIIAPAIFSELLPLLIGLLVAPFIIALCTLLVDDLFLGLLGAMLQAIGRGLLIIPMDPANIIYYAGMLCGIYGNVMLMLGMLGATFKKVHVHSIQDKDATMPALVVSGLFAGVALNVILRFPGIDVAENQVANYVLITILLASAMVWYTNIEKKHPIRKNLDQIAGFKRKKDKRFRKTAHLFMLGPSFAILGFYFNRYEWLSAATGLTNIVLGYILIIAILMAPLIHTLCAGSDRAIEICGMACTSLAFVGIGLMLYLPTGLYMLVFIVPAPLGIYITINRVIRLTGREHANNVDITIIVAWMLGLLGMIGPALLTLLVFVPYAGIIIIAPLVAYWIIHLAVNGKKTSGGMS